MKKLFIFFVLFVMSISYCQSPPDTLRVTLTFSIAMDTLSVSKIENYLLVPDSGGQAVPIFKIAHITNEYDSIFVGHWRKVWDVVSQDSVLIFERVKDWAPVIKSVVLFVGPMRYNAWYTAIVTNVKSYEGFPIIPGQHNTVKFKVILYDPNKPHPKLHIQKT